MQVDNATELGHFVDRVYTSIGGSQSKYDALFQKIIGGCHCIPPTEWFGDVYLTFRKLLEDHAIIDETLTKQAEEVVGHFQDYFQY